MNNNIVVLSPPATPPPMGLYFSLNGVIHLPGDSVSITDIGSTGSGDAGSTLMCVTSNVNTNCCSGSDGGRVGEWYHPDGTIVPRNAGNPGDDIFVRTGFTQQVRLNRRANATGPLGVYRCDVPDPSGANISASITIQRQGVCVWMVSYICVVYAVLNLEAYIYIYIC